MADEERSQAQKATDRRTFIKRTAAAGLGLGMAGTLGPVASSYARAPLASGAPPSDTLVVAVMGVNSRGNALAQSFAKTDGAEVGYICDVDERAVEKTIADLAGPPQQQAAADSAAAADSSVAAADSAAAASSGGSSAPLQERRPEGITDFRRALDDDDVDALVIATPDHWHAPATLLALEAGKHVYVEKPCSHNPREGEMLVEAQEKYPDLVIQMGNQQRSSPRSMEIIERIRNGDVIGDAYYARAWYSNNRGPTRLERPAEVPAWLDYELWQGPAPDEPYASGLIHYNWHWFWHWGTGEILNNGTHEIDVCRWALDVDYPTRVTSVGGRYAYDDDWEAFDTQVAGYDFPGEKSIAWEGRSCNPTPLKGGGGPGSGGRGASVHGTEGTVRLDRSGYIVHDMDNNVVEENVRGQDGGDQTNTVGAGSLTDLHVENFVQAVQGQAEPHSPIGEVRPSVLLCHLGNIAQRTGTEVDVDPETGQPSGEEAKKLWSREYAPDWEPKV